MRCQWLSKSWRILWTADDTPNRVLCLLRKEFCADSVQSSALTRYRVLRLLGTSFHLPGSAKQHLAKALARKNNVEKDCPNSRSLTQIRDSMIVQAKFAADIKPVLRAQCCESQKESEHSWTCDFPRQLQGTCGPLRQASDANADDVW